MAMSPAHASACEGRVVGRQRGVNEPPVEPLRDLDNPMAFLLRAPCARVAPTAEGRAVLGGAAFVLRTFPALFRPRV